MAKNSRQNTKFNEELKEFVSFIKRREQIEDSEVRASWEEVNRIVSKQNQKRNLRYLWIGVSTAASIALLLAVGFYSFRPVEQSFVSQLGKHSTPIDSLNQIRLVVAEEHQMELENESVINYDEKGSLTVNNQQCLQVEEEKTVQESRLNHIIVPKGKRTHITLSDGTKMYVNAASHVIYPSVFNEKKREIAVEGEVYLEVAHNPKAPFIVKTKGLDVKVLGTTFNVSAYKEQEISVVLVEGSVEVKSSAKEMKMSPSQMVCLKEGVLEKQEVNVEKYICWKDNLMLLDNESVGKVLDRLSLYYGVPIWCDKSVADRKLSGKLDLCESIDAVMDIVKESASLRAEKIEGGGFRFLK